VTNTVDPDEVCALIRGADALGVELNSDVASALLRFLARFYDWNRFGGFTRIPRDSALRLHLLDSLSVVAELRGVRSIVDLGTGGGMPGIPLALVLSETAFTLVESRGRRCSFLREIVREYELSARVEILECDASEVGAMGRRYDAVVSRAFLPPPELLTLGCGLVGPGGRIIVMASSEAWLVAAPTARVPGEGELHLRSERTLVLPDGMEQRRIFLFERS